MSRKCWLSTSYSGELFECALLDLQRGKALVATAKPDQIPARVFVFLTEDRKVSREGTVTSRDGQTILFDLEIP
jgi:hypothetical protein